MYLLRPRLHEDMDVRREMVGAKAKQAKVEKVVQVAGRQGSIASAYDYERLLYDPKVMRPKICVRKLAKIEKSSSSWSDRSQSQPHGQ